MASSQYSSPAQGQGRAATPAGVSTGDGLDVEGVKARSSDESLRDAAVVVSVEASASTAFAEKLVVGGHLANQGDSAGGMPSLAETFEGQPEHLRSAYPDVPYSVSSHASAQTTESLPSIDDSGHPSRWNDDGEIYSIDGSNVPNLQLISGPAPAQPPQQVRESKSRSRSRPKAIHDPSAFNQLNSFNRQSEESPTGSGPSFLDHAPSLPSTGGYHAPGTIIRPSLSTGNLRDGTQGYDTAAFARRHGAGSPLKHSGSNSALQEIYHGLTTSGASTPTVPPVPLVPSGSRPLFLTNSPQRPDELTRGRPVIALIPVTLPQVPGYFQTIHNRYIECVVVPFAEGLPTVAKGQDIHHQPGEDSSCCVAFT
ncbi:hypothetical protein BKA70DRAFT_1425900 [Coprinopsis sp. MPI-PUGE-AT-0042]|nr:hypothetical protein BKA70DRAFT_1425900 [Coprinopsis sp. MPI-PUGE-AT-0042]